MKTLNQLCVLLLFVGLGLTSGNVAQASSHREAPKISQDPAADQTDVYAFRSPSNPDHLVLAGNYYPLTGPGAGPNYYRFSDDVVYAFHIDQDGDAMEDVTYAFRFNTTVNNGNTFLSVLAPMSSPEDMNVVQGYDVYRIEGSAKDLEAGMVARNRVTSGVVAPPVIGEKSQPDYDSLAEQAIVRAGGQGTFFAGPRDDSFFVDLNVFDLLNLGAGVDSLAGTNVQSIVFEVPISRLTHDGRAADTTAPVLGVWGATYRYSPDLEIETGTAAKTKSATANVSSSRKDFSQDRRFIYSRYNNARRNAYGRWNRNTTARNYVRVTPGTMPRVKKGGWKQISRLGMPLVNEAVVPLAYKDYFNSSHPSKDATTDAYAQVVLNSELAGLFKAVLGIDAPTTNREDLVTVFLTGVPGLNQPANVQAAEVLRINVTTPLAETENRLGVFGGDNAGFPNGRRLADDVTDVAVQAVAGKLVDGYDVSADLGDGVNANDKAFSTTFPYLAAPHTATK